MFKRIFDIFFSFLGLIILFPLIVFVSFLINFDSKGPIFFRQIRVGKNQKNFRVHKFRTMYCQSEKMGLITTASDKRITKVGRWLRKFKIDEIPQLIDVFQGKMSFVGPRPEVPKYVKNYPEEVKKIIFSVKPGITDQASLKFKNENELFTGNEESYENFYVKEILPKKLNLSIRNIKNQNLMNDILIIIKTIVKIFI